MSVKSFKFGRRLLLLIASFFLLAPYRVLSRYLVRMPLVYLTWRQDPTSTIVVNWMDNDSNSPDYVMYRQSALPLSRTWKLAKGYKHNFADDKKRIIHHVELHGLNPDTEYIFTIGSKEPASVENYLKFRTLPKLMPSNLRFVTGGDMMHDRKKLDAMNKRAAELNPWFALLGGDLAYANADKKNVSNWEDWLESWMLNCVRKIYEGLFTMVVEIGNK